jgi:signal transduction histidine kinase
MRKMQLPEEPGWRMSQVPELLKSDEARYIFEEIKAQGSYRKSFPSSLPADDRAFLTAELYVRTSRYQEIETDIPQGTSEWYRRLALCTGRLFTSLNKALEELTYLESENEVPMIRPRFISWRMHLNFLTGCETEGTRLRRIVEEGLDTPSPWDVEKCTLIAISYFSSGHSKKAVEYHLKALELAKKFPDRYFESFGAAMGSRAALKIFDAPAFDVFSQKLDDSLGVAFDSRYKLRQLGYRAMTHTQLGEVELAKEYWDEGDKLLAEVDLGAATLERAQFLMFRCLAAALLGDESLVEITYEKATFELRTVEASGIHEAELEICRRLSPVANPVIRSNNVKRSCEILEAARAFFVEKAILCDVESVRIYYREAVDFCDFLLGNNKKVLVTGDGDAWRTLTISVIANFQSFLKFAEQINYFRLIPQFVQEIQSSNLTDDAMTQVIEKLIKMKPLLIDGKFELPFERREVYKTSQVERLLIFASTLRGLYRKAEENAKALVLADTVQTVAHDFKRPFNLLQSMLNTISLTEDPGKIKSVAESAIPRVAAAIDEVKNLMNDIASTTRERPLRKEMIWSKDVVDLAINSTKASIDDFKYDLDLSRSLLNVDAHKFSRVLANIIENAVEADPGDKVWIKSRDDLLDGKPAVVFTIRNRSSILEKNLPLVFRKTFSEGKKCGTGLGLYIAKQIVEQHGGRVQCRSTNQSGTEFDVIVPRD